jgi:hypothetical protein
MTDRSSCYIRHPNARNCRRRRGNSPDLMLCDGLWMVLCISTWRLFYAFPRHFRKETASTESALGGLGLMLLHELLEPI